ncbi:MAG: hypothetical protein ABJN69_17410 [Hellea sp.]
MSKPTRDKELTNQAVINRVGFDSLLEDIFGLNIRAIKTIGVLFKAPSKYFKAAKAPDWVNQFTPSFRVWFGLMALLAALKFLYTSDDNAMVQAYVGLMEQLKTDLNSAHPDSPKDFDTLTAGKDLLKWIFVYFPFIYIPIMALLAVIYRAWTENLTYVTRLRFIFGTVIPSSVFTVFITIATVFLSASAFSFVAIVSYGAMVFLDFTTAFRGPYAHVKSTASRIGRSLALTATLLFVYVLTALIAMMPAFFMVLKNI